MAAILSLNTAQKTAYSPLYRRTGAALAIKYNKNNCSITESKQVQINGWGGARNTGQRQSNALTSKQVELLIGAAQCAAIKEMPLNRHITVHWGKLGISDKEAAKVTSRLLKAIGDNLKKSGAPFAAIWVREHGSHEMGSHIHIIAHIPNNRLGLLTRRQRGWVSKACGQPYKATALRGRPVAGAGRSESVYEANLAAVLGYVMKGADSEAIKAYGLTRQKAGGTIIGKRCGTTTNIGRAAWPAGIALRHNSGTSAGRS